MGLLLHTGFSGRERFRFPTLPQSPSFYGYQFIKGRCWEQLLPFKTPAWILLQLPSQN